MSTDPRVKLLYLVIITFWSFLSSDILFLLILLSIQITISFLSQQFKEQMLVLFSLRFYLLLLIAMNILFFWDKVPYSFYAIILIKVLILVLTSISLLGNTSPEELILAFEKLGLPSDIAWSVGSAIRLLDDIKREIFQITTAQKLRGINFQTKNPFKRASNMYSILSPLLTHSFVRSNQMAQALSTRQWVNANARTNVFPLLWTLRDTYFTILLFIFGVILPVAFCFNIISPIK
ncbi:MAG: energy-coupling factor transporter transmembrane component T [Candidatus Kariarchaeaceae archaeon]